MKQVQWDRLKSERLKKVRGVSFEEIIATRIVDRLDHPARESQKLLLFEYKNYIWVVPYVENDGLVFLKTLYPSRKYTKLYLGKD
ncbi:MAG: toxin [Lentisphaerota bacterium]